MNNIPRTSSAQINPIIAIAVALVALLAVLLILNPPRVVDSPDTPSTPPPMNETPIDNTNDPNANNDETSDSTSSSSSPSETPSQDASASCANDDDLTRDGTWRAQMDSETRTLLEQIVASFGGLEKLNALCTFYGQGDSELSSQGQTISSEVELWLRMPNQVRNLVKVALPIPGQFIETLIVWEGSKGWTKALNPQTFQVEVTEIPSDLKVQAIEEISLNPVLSLLAVQDASASFTYLGTEQDPHMGAHAIQFRTSLGSTGTYFYDTDTLRTMSLFREGGGRTVEKLFSDYKNVEGYALPHVITTTIQDPELGELSTKLTYESIEVNSALEPSLFRQPPSN